MNKGFCKGLIWYYEKETRLLIHLKGEAEKALENGKNYVITLSFDEELKKSFKITFAPEIADINEILQLTGYSAIKSFFDESSRVMPSVYRGSVKMDLCRTCTRCDSCESKKRENVNHG